MIAILFETPLILEELLKPSTQVSIYEDQKKLTFPGIYRTIGLQQGSLIPILESWHPVQFGDVPALI